MLKLLRFLKSESERIAFVRTVAPIVWSFVLVQAADIGLRVDQIIADAIDGPDGIDPGFVNTAATAILIVVLWVVARFAPAWFERALMLIPVKNYAYSRPDDSLVVASGRVEHAASVIDDINESAVLSSDGFVRTFIARQPSPIALRAAAQQLLEAADDTA